MSYTCSIAQARGLAVAAAGLAAPRPARARGRAQARRRAIETVGTLGYVQVDSVNVVARAQDMMLFSRIGAVPSDVLTTPPSWARIPSPAGRASLTGAGAPHVTPARPRPVPGPGGALGPRGQHSHPRDRPPHLHFPTQRPVGSRSRHPEHPEWADSRRHVLDLLTDRPATALAVADQISRGDPGRRRLAESCALDAFARGELVSIGHTPTFQRILARPERLWPDLWDRDAAPGPADAARELTRIALRGLGIARTSTVADWFRRPVPVVREALAHLEAAGLARRVEVAGTASRPADPWWIPAPALLDEGVSPLPRPVCGEVAGARDGDAPARDRVRLLSPFDPLVAHRPRLLELFGIHYRIGIYTPADKRRYGYYDLLVLRGNDIVGRIDLRADRSAGILRVMGFWLEPGPDRSPARHARSLRPELARVARWQGLAGLSVDDGAGGDGVEALRRVL